jgi:hypothetical protein
MAHPWVICKGGNLGRARSGGLVLKAGVRSTHPFGEEVSSLVTQKTRKEGHPLRNRVSRNQNQLALAIRRNSEGIEPPLEISCHGGQNYS